MLAYFDIVADLVPAAQMLSKKLPPAVSGARAANAGNEFHFRYAARRALRLLDPKSGLRQVRIEQAEQPATTDQFLGVDMSEYFGGFTLSNSARVVASQLKYSVTNPTQEWTAARLCRQSAKSSTSVIGRLAGDYIDFCRSSSARAVREKLTIQLVSNQPANIGLVLALQALKGLSAVLRQPSFTRLRLLVSPGQRAVLDRLYTSSRLGARQFCEFVETLDLTRCGEGSLATQDELLLQEGGPMLGNNPLQSLKGLVEYVRTLALPGTEHLDIRRETVLAHLGAISEQDLFPAPAMLSRPQLSIPTADLKNLVNAMDSSDRILAHGPAGIGKSTTLQLLEEHLPENSAVLIFDCWGEGQCFEWGGARHSYPAAIRQILNELAVRFGLPLFIGQLSETDDWERRLKRRVEFVADFLGSKGGRLVLAIDAADNAVTASKQTSPTFVQRLWTLSFPTNCTLIMTARTHRVDALEAPANVAKLQLVGFDEVGSSEHVKKAFPTLTNDQSIIFHELTSGNPRLQSYKIAEATRLGDSSLVLKEHPGSLEELFTDLIASVTSQFHDPELGRSLLACVACMSRPIGIREFAGANGVDFATAHAFLTGLEPGIIIRDGQASLRDEDFDAFIRIPLSPADLKVAHEKLATFLMATGLTDAYAVRSIADHLAQAGRTQELIDLAIHGTGLANVRDSVLRGQTQRHRIELALAEAANLGRHEDCLKLILLALNDRRTDAAFTELIKTSPDLASRFGDPSAISTILLRSENEPWLGPAHMRAALLCSHDENRRADAIWHLSQADAWLKRYFASRNDADSRGWQLTFEDIATAAHAIYLLHGAVAAFEYVRRWTPRRETISALAKSVAASVDTDKLSTDLETINAPSFACALFACEMWRNGKTPSPWVLDTAADSGLQRRAEVSERYRDRVVISLIDLAEARVSCGLDHEPTRRMLEKIPRIDIRDLSRTNRTRHQYDVPLRVQSLLSAMADRPTDQESLYPPELHPQNSAQRSYDQEKRHFAEDVAALIPTYDLRARAICKIDESTAIDQSVRSLFELDVMRPVVSVKGNQALYRDRFERLTDALLYAEIDSDSTLTDLAYRVREGLGSSCTSLWIDTCERLARDSRISAASSLLEEIPGMVEGLSVPPRERWELLLDAAVAALRCDEQLSHDIYLKAVETAEGVDDETAELVATMTMMMRRLGRDAPSRTRAILLRLAMLTEALSPYVSAHERLGASRVIGSVAQVWPSAALPLAAKWHDTEFVNLWESLPESVMALAKGRFLPTIVAMALLCLVPGDFPIWCGLKLLDTQELIDPGQLMPAVEFLARQIFLNTGCTKQVENAEELSKWTSSRNLKLDYLDDRVQLIRNSRKKSTVPDLDTFQQRHAARIAELLAQIPSGSSEDLPAMCAECLKEARDANDIEALAVAINPRITYGQRVGFLSSLNSLPGLGYQTNYLAMLLTNLLARWQTSAAVRDATSPIVSAFLENHGPSMRFYDTADQSHLTGLIQVANLNLTVFRSLSIMVASNLERLSSWQLKAYSIGSSLAVNEAGLVDVANWMCEAVESGLVVKSTPVDVLDYNPGEEWPQVVSGFLVKMMGDTDRQLRWRAAHASRYILRFADSDFSEKALRLLAAQKVPGYANSENEFRWMSAQAMLLLLLQRTAEERPELLQSHVGAIADVASNLSFPHAQIRELARQTVLALNRAGIVIPQSVLESVQLCNQPVSLKLPRGISYEGRGRFGRSKKLTFDFNELDTVPYLYDPLDRVFDHPKPDALARGDRWISKRWSRTTEECRVDMKKREYSNDWEEWYASHGSLPRNEDLRHYLELNALMCAAGEMCDERLAACISEYDPPDDSWVEFLDAYLPASWSNWTSDLRTALPTFPPLITNSDALDEAIATDGDLLYLRQLIGLQDESAKSMFIYMDATNSDYGRSIYLDVRSAFAPSRTSLSFALAIQDTGRYEFYMPVEDGEVASRYDEEEDPPEFTLTPVAARRKREAGWDKFDPFVQSDQLSLMTLSTPLLNSEGLFLDPKTFAVYDGAGGKRAALEWWDATQRTSRYQDSHGPQGIRLSADKAVLQEYMRKNDLELVIAVQITRSSKSDDNGRQKQKEQTGAQTFIFRKDGTIDDVSRNIKTG